jgi:hypothetical protein
MFCVGVGWVDAGVAVGFCDAAGVGVDVAVAVVFGVSVGVEVDDGVCVGAGVGAGDVWICAAAGMLEVAPKLSVTVAVTVYEPAEVGKRLNVDAVCPCWAVPFTYHW